jgi:hypothetical protein
VGEWKEYTVRVGVVGGVTGAGMTGTGVMRAELVGAEVAGAGGLGGRPSSRERFARSSSNVRPGGEDIEVRNNSKLVS